jgi:pyruvate dehydrogenase E1 component
LLIGATAGRTTLSGEGLQHQDGSSHLIASTVPNCRAWDPAYGYELATIVEDGTRRMLENQEDLIYYITVMNENYVQPAMPEGAREGILKGMYLLQWKPDAAVQLLGSGTILREAAAAAELLKNDFGIAANVWSVTSWSELRRDGMACERHNRLNPAATPKVSHLAAALAPHPGPVIAASDHVTAVADLIRAQVPGRYVALGTDGYGRSDSRENLRRFFEMDRHHIVVAALAALADEGAVGRDAVADALKRYGIRGETAPPWEI